MLRIIRYTAILAILLILSPVVSQAQDCGPIDRTQLRKMLVELGFEIKDLEKAAGKEKYEVTIVKDGLNVPIAYEISPSTNYIWLTVYLGNPTADTSIKNIALLKQNAKVQPCQFYISEKGRLMLGLAIENRGVTNAVLRRHSETVSSRVAETKTYWQ